MNYGYEEITHMVLENDSKVKQLSAYQAFQKELDRNKVSIDELAFALSYNGDIGDESTNDQAIIEAYDELLTEFRETYGVNIFLTYHDKNSFGDASNRVDGHYFGYLVEEDSKIIEELKNDTRLVTFSEIREVRD